MNKDFITGLFVSATLHFAIVNWGHPSPPPAHPPRTRDEAAPPIVMPPIEEEKPEPVNSLPQETPQQQVAVPTLPDLPTNVTINSFTEPLTPPQSPDIIGDKVVTIPITRPTGPGKSDGIFNPDQVNQKPIARVQTQPNYPYEMSKQGISGEVLVEFVVDQKGDVIDSRVVRSSNREFEASALQAVQKWKFKAGRKGGQPVKVRVSQLLEFNLDDLK